MGIIGDSLDKAAANVFTRPIPKTAGAQIRFLVKHEKGSTRTVARRLGISQRTVERYLTGQIKKPRPDLAAKLAAEVRKNWQPVVRQRARKQAATATGITIETRARFGFTAAPGTTDDGRLRLITQHLPPVYADRLFRAKDTGSSEQDMQNIIAEGLQEVYFKDHGRRANDLLVEFTDIDYLETDYS
ncbi:telomere-protecting terminal protein Tpg [Streptomyces sp. NBC_00344]|uniref:telomere-protecting terminal protein Tpg n=1 Tax=Streptomyces sp. NBC_00344 TaxID=2975720 RepID=UPI002E1A18CC